MEPCILALPDGRTLAYHRVAGRGPGVIFLGGFRSDMTGTKAQFIEAWAKSRGQAFVRFDYSGHGASSGEFEQGCVGDWARDASDILAMTEGPQILVGSSMGGWIALLLAVRAPKRVAGLVGISAAPDFTEDAMWEQFSPEQRDELLREGALRLPSDYSDEGYFITLRLIEDGRCNLVLRDRLELPFPVRLLHGTDDRDVDISVPLRLAAHATAPDLRLTLVKGADHRFSSPANLDLIAGTIEEIL